MTMPAMLEVAIVVAAQAIGAWLVTYLVHGAIVFAAVRLLERARENDPAWRAALWRTALLGPPLTATLQTLLPHFSRPLAMSMEPAGAVLGPRPLLSLVVILAWGALLGVGVIRLALAHRRSRAAFGRREPARDPRHGAMVARLARTAGLRVVPRVTMSARTFSPAAFGRDEVCLPRTVFDDLLRDEQEALAAHEIAHLIRRDPLWSGMAAAAATLFAFHPVNRIALRRLKEAAEQAADAGAVRTTGDPLALARALSALAPHAMRGVRPATAATGSPLLDRVRRILDGRAIQPRSVQRGHTLALVTALLLVCASAGPGVRFSAGAAANAIPWLAPSRQAPGPRMLEIRAFERRLREVVREPAAIVVLRPRGRDR